MISMIIFSYTPNNLLKLLPSDNPLLNPFLPIHQIALQIHHNTPTSPLIPKTNHPKLQPFLPHSQPRLHFRHIDLLQRHPKWQFQYIIKKW